MVTAEVFDPIPSIPHDAILETSRKALGNRVNETISADDLTKLIAF